MEWVPIEKVSPIFKSLLIFSEDKRFYSHSGIDYLALASGFYRFLTFSKKKRGASTITMQLVSLLDPSLRSKSGGRSFKMKFYQMGAANKIEDKWSKSGILEAYINLVTYRGELIGIDSASRGLFQKAPHSLNYLESLLLISLIKSPQGSIKKIIRRGCYLSARMKSKMSCSEIKKKFRSVLKKKYIIPSNHQVAFHIASRIARSKEKKRVYHTTLDEEIQRFSIQSLHQHLLDIKKQNVNDGAVLVVENSTGKILAYVGSSGELSDSWQVDVIQSRRQAGSTLKPFLYALAFENNLLQPQSYLDDNPVEIQVGTGIYKPGNYQNSFHGRIKAKIALASSLNVPAVKVLSLVGVRNFVMFLKQIGFELKYSYEHYGLSVALGSPDITLMELVNAYRILANSGVYSDLYYETGTKSKIQKRVLSKKVSESISSILSNRENRMLTFGLENPLSTRYWSAVKTGTSKDMRDNWCIGYTKEFTVGVWVGNVTGKPMWNVSGISGAAPVWIDIMNWLSTNKSRNKKLNNMHLETKNLKESFIPLHEKVIQGISKPTNKSIIAFDPDIPESRHRVFFESRVLSKDHFWVLNGKKLASAEDVYFWKPSKGFYTLILVDKNNEEVEKVYFEVR